MSTNPDYYIRAPKGTQPPYDSNVRVDASSPPPPFPLPRLT
jgi:hypothetical protein